MSKDPRCLSLLRGDVVALLRCADRLIPCIVVTLALGILSVRAAYPKPTTPTPAASISEFKDALAVVDVTSVWGTVVAAQEFRARFSHVASKLKAEGLQVWYDFVREHAPKWCSQTESFTTLLAARRFLPALDAAVPLSVAAGDPRVWFGVVYDGRYAGGKLTHRRVEKKEEFNLEPLLSEFFRGNDQHLRRMSWLEEWRIWNRNWDRAETVSNSDAWIEPIVVQRNLGLYSLDGDMQEATVGGRTAKVVYDLESTTLSATWGTTRLFSRKLPHFRLCNEKDFERAQLRDRSPTGCSVFEMRLAEARMSGGAFHITFSSDGEWQAWVHLVIPFKQPAEMPSPFIYCDNVGGFEISVSAWVRGQLGSPTRSLFEKVGLSVTAIGPLPKAQPLPSELAGVERALANEDLRAVLGIFERASLVSMRPRDKLLPIWSDIFTRSDAAKKQ